MEYIVLIILLIVFVVINYIYFDKRYNNMTEEEKELDRQVREMRGDNDERLW